MLFLTEIVRSCRTFEKRTLKIYVKEVVILDTAGVSTMYANNGGVIAVL